MQGYWLQDTLTNTSLPEAVALLNRTALSGGKHIRPALCLLVGRFLGLTSAAVMPYASAAEQVHNATLIHDDVIDEAHERRGRPTLNASGFNRRAVLAGDLLLARALKEVGDQGNLKILQDLQLTLLELVEGEWLQLEARGNLNVDQRHLRTVARMKTASLMRWCCSTPARLAGLSEADVQAWWEFGEHLGVGFQMADDCVDFSVTSGKPFSQDLREGQINFVSLQLMADVPEFRAVANDWLGSQRELSPSTAPWSSEQLQSAQAKVRHQAQIEIEIAFAKLARLIDQKILRAEDLGELESLCELILKRSA